MAQIQDSGQQDGKYVVRGTPIQCSCGSAKDVLNLPFSHHVYVGEAPAMRVTDCVVGKNIISFGSCSSSSNPDAKEEIEEQKWVVFSETKVIDKAATGMLACTPVIPPGQSRWIQPQDHVLINNEPALLDCATLVCSNGGTITIEKK
ncbi:DUF4280 domain-containing protein [Paenibacillus polymyxa]|uniref:DUF4280 domain-containing protein n=1 Tax=Paenibacillus polymyxa TaxID=1406 RepID=UPI002ED544F8|nr:DUF4280 domain-containing protein [Paenibacillus polymyxa]